MALPMAFQMAIPMAFQIYLKHILVFKKNIMCRQDLSRLHDIPYIESVGHIPRLPNGVSNLFETKPWCSKKNIMCRRDLSRLHDLSHIKIRW